MKVIIVGGGLAGLTLARALEKGHIDFILLEARSRFDPQVGASIGMNAASMRIFDQLGAAQEIIEHTAPIRVFKVHRRDGSLIMAPSRAFQLLKARFGYEVSFLDRQFLLRSLVNSIVQKEKMLLNKNSIRINHSNSGVSVECEDGSRYHGDVLVGCDGVNSRSCVRAEMRRIANEANVHNFPETEEIRMTAQYSCLFGISGPVSGLEEGDVDSTIDTGTSMLVITGKDGRVFWFYQAKLAKVYQYHAADFPKFTKADAEAMASQNAWRNCNETVKLGDLWEKRLSYTLVALEEALFDKWSWGRIATVGDNAHKMTPNHGQAGNNAVESAAALANQLKKVHDGRTITSETIDASLQRWHQKRKVRIEATVAEAAAICRMQVLDGWKARFLIFWVMPCAAELLLTLITGTLIGAEVLEYLPVPEQSFEGSCPFNQRHGVGNHESTPWRALKAAPMLLIAICTVQQTSVDSDLRTVGALMFPASLGHRQWLHCFGLLCGAAVVYAIWLIESNRRANAMTLAKLPVVFVMLSLFFGPSSLGSCYFFLHYISSPVERFAAADMRLTNLVYTQTVLPLLLCIIGVPLALLLMDFDRSHSDTIWIYSWILLPAIAMPIIPRLLSKLDWSRDTMHEDAMNNQSRDLPTIRYCIRILSIISASTWVLNGCIGAWYSSLENRHGLLTAENMYHTWNGLHAAGFLWLCLFFQDLKDAHMIDSSWSTIIVLMAGTTLFAGPSVCIALGWMWREEILAVRKEGHALTRERYAGKSVDEVAREGIGRGQRELQTDGS